MLKILVSSFTTGKKNLLRVSYIKTVGVFLKLSFLTKVSFVFLFANSVKLKEIPSSLKTTKSNYFENRIPHMNG